MPEELVRVEKLINQANLEEALEIIENFEKKETLTHEDQLATLLLKGRIYSYNDQYRDAVKIGEIAYKMSQKLGRLLESIDALVLRSYIGDIDKALELILEAEKLLNSLTGKSTSDLSIQSANILSRKSWLYFYKMDLNTSLESNRQCLSLLKKRGNRFEIASNFLIGGYIYWNLLELDAAFNYAMKSLDIMEELNFHRGIANSSTLVSNIYLAKGDFNQALIFCKKSFSIKEISNRTKLINLNLLGAINYQKGDIDKSLKYYNQARALAEEIHHPDQLALSLYQLGYVSRMKGEYDRGIELNETSLRIAENVNYPYVVCMSLVVLILIYLDKGSREQAEQYLVRLKKLSDQIQQKYIKQMYLLSKAIILKMSGRTSNRSEAEVLLRKIVEKHTYFYPEPQFQALINLCDLYLEDLKVSNNLEILEDINPVITQLLNLAEELHSYLYLAETKLLQAKLELIQMNIPKAKQLMAEAQRIAELHGLDLLARKISHEHDELLKKLPIWENLKKSEAPLTKRMKLSRLNEQMEYMKRNRIYEVPELSDEESVLLLIISEGGTPFFSHTFIEDYSFEDHLFGGFLSAINSFVGEMFSEGLDRVSFGEHTLIMNALSPFFVCYIFKGQSYSAQHKIKSFINKIQRDKDIWDTFEQFYQLNKEIQLKSIPSLEYLIKEIFIDKKIQLTS